MSACGGDLGRFRCRCGEVYDCGKHLAEHRAKAHPLSRGYGMARVLRIAEMRDGGA